MTQNYNLKLRGTAIMRNEWIWMNIPANLYFIKDTAILQDGNQVDCYSWSPDQGEKQGSAQMNASKSTISVDADYTRYVLRSDVITTGTAEIFEVIP
jgi:hypothetical protein